MNGSSVGNELRDTAAIKDAEDELNSLTIFKSGMGAMLSHYTLGSQLFDFGRTRVMMRSILSKRLLPLLKFGRERKTVVHSKVVLG
ncbi:hypothetical protein [Cyanobium sp. Lug-B]|uniref:hypothetical protein n=1 Tax=Cyanobium sp. Lug-B TaxID=2823716 RepID=UPI0020CE86AA|nr:hypothetical protein [Cyanobium sp. Lug-B]MCP9796202.1 hypothetical protein [Cyanobium sp. Lug-B]